MIQPSRGAHARHRRLRRVHRKDPLGGDLDPDVPAGDRAGGFDQTGAAEDPGVGECVAGAEPVVGLAVER